MKKKILFVLSLLTFIALLAFLSDLIIIKVQNILEQRMLSVFPEGSYIERIRLKGLTGVSADSIYIKDICFLPGVEVTYSPVGILRRRIKKLSFDSPKFFIKEGQKESETGCVGALFFIEEVEVNNGSVKWKGHNFQELNGKGEIFSTGRGNIVVFLPKLRGKIDEAPFLIQEIDLSISNNLSSMNIRNITVGDSEFEIRTTRNGKIEGNGRIYLSDLGKLFRIKGEGFLDVFFAYDTTFTFKGESRVVTLQGFNLPQFSFNGVRDSVNIIGKELAGFFHLGKEIYGQIQLAGLDMKKISSKYPDTKLTGSADFTYKNKNTLSIISRLTGEVLGSPLENLNLVLNKRGKDIYIDSCSGHYSGGNFVFEGVYGDKIDGDLKIEKIDVSPIAEFFRIKVSAVLNIGLSIGDKVYGAFSLENLKFHDMKITSVEGNLSLVQKEREFPGTITLISRGFTFKDRKIFEFGESNLGLENKKLDVKGFFKTGEKKLDYQFALDSDTVEIKDIRFEYPEGWLYLMDPFSFIYKNAFRLKNVRFAGSRGEDFQINNVSVLPMGIEGDINLIRFRPEFLNEFGIFSHPFSGKLSSTVSIGGKPSSPAFYFKGGGKINIGEEEIGDSLNFVFQYGDNIISVENLSIVENNKNSNLDGMIDLGKKSLHVDIKLQEPGTWVFYPLIKHITVNRAKLSGNLKIRGEFEKPLIYGGISLNGAGVLVRNPGLHIKELNAMALFEGEEGRLEKISALLGEGKVQGEGSISLTDKEFDIKLSLENTPINWQYVNTTVDGTLEVRKNRKNIEVKGNVDLKKATITMEFEQKGEKGRRPANLFLDLTFDATQGNVWIRNDLSNIELMGKVGVSYKGGPLLLSGNLEVKQGMFYYLYKTFEVLEGKFNFNESPEINPNIDVKAMTLISSGSNGSYEQDTVFLEVSGTMKVPEFDIYSKSSLTKAEIMTLLSLNVGWEDLASVKSLEQSVGTAFSYWVRQTLNRRLKEEFGIDVLEMQGGGGHYEFIVGKYVTDRLFVKARTDIQSYGISEIQAEYKLKKWGYMTAEKDFLGKTRFLFNLEWRY